MVKVTVGQSFYADCYQLAATMRVADAREMRLFGVNDLAVGMLNLFKCGVLQRSYFVDGELAAMSGLTHYGVATSLLDDTGYPYLFTAPPVERAIVSFVRHARLAVAEMLQIKKRLLVSVAADYDGANGLVRHLGFREFEVSPDRRIITYCRER